jgi:hypothetical protein
VKSFQLICSFTGERYTGYNLNRKVFGNELIPFIGSTHAVFGDKEQIKSTVSDTIKQQLLQMAQNEVWTSKTLDYVREKVIQMVGILPISFGYK